MIHKIATTRKGGAGWGWHVGYWPLLSLPPFLYHFHLLCVRLKLGVLGAGTAWMARMLWAEATDPFHPDAVLFPSSI